MSVVDNAVYVDGQRLAELSSLETTYGLMREHRGMAWIGLYRPDAAAIRSVTEEFGIHRLAAEDTIKAHQRPKLERYGDVHFVVLHPARYVDAEERVEFGEVHVFTGADFVVTVRHAEAPDLARVRSRLEGDPALLRLGPEAVLYAILDQVVDEYAPVVAGMENDIDEIEDQVFSGDEEVSRRIYELYREVVTFQRATQPLIGMLEALVTDADADADPDGYAVPEELRRHLRDVLDHATRVVERVEGMRALLQNILTVNATLVAQRQNEEARRLTETSVRQNEQLKRISSWAAILFAPTLVGTVYGMNFDHMPELHWSAGYPLALLMMALVSGTLYLVFRRSGWL